MSSNYEQNQLPNEVAKEDAYLSSLVLGSMQIFSAFLNAAIDLNVFEIIAKSGSSMSASEIAAQLPNQHPDLANRLDRMLPLLASFSVLTCSIRMNENGKSERVYALSPIGECFSYDNDGVSAAPAATLLHRGMGDLWKDVKDIFLDADDMFCEKVFGMSLFQHAEQNKELGDMFNRAMTHSGSIQVKMVLKMYDGFEGVSTLVDVGGGVGQTLKLIISKYPTIKGINFDLPHVVQNAPSHPGIEHVGGDMFKSVPKGDAIIMKLVCHNWSDEKCVDLLRICHKALPQHGKVIILDIILPEVPNSSAAVKHAFLVNNIMILAHGGKERTVKEFESLCKSSGFSRFHVARNDPGAMLGVLEFHK